MVQDYKQEFMLDGACYLNCAYMGPVPQRANLAGREGFAQKVLVLGFLCATSVSSVTLWCVFTGNSSTTETQSTQRLHGEERNRDFLCKAGCGFTTGCEIR